MSVIRVCLLPMNLTVLRRAKGYVFGRVIKWWHGHGCLLDYWNPAAVAFWHAHIKKMFDYYDLSVDGWKVDGVDPYVLELLNPKYVGARVLVLRRR